MIYHIAINEKLDKIQIDLRSDYRGVISKRPKCKYRDKNVECNYGVKFNGYDWEKRMKLEVQIESNNKVWSNRGLDELW